MVVGRAVNGWTEGILPEHLALPAAAETYSQVVLTSVNGDAPCPPCPMTWVTNQWGNTNKGYNTRRSAFWRVIRGVVDGLGIADVEQDAWSSHLVWSNLYKIAPANGRNPSKTLSDIQLARVQRSVQPGTDNLHAFASAAPDRDRMGLTFFLLTLNPHRRLSPGFRYVEEVGTLRIAPRQAANPLRRCGSPPRKARAAVDCGGVRRIRPLTTGYSEALRAASEPER